MAATVEYSGSLACIWHLEEIILNHFVKSSSLGPITNSARQVTTLVFMYSFYQNQVFDSTVHISTAESELVPSVFI